MNEQHTEEGILWLRADRGQFQGNVRMTDGRLEKLPLQRGHVGLENDRIEQAGCNTFEVVDQCGNVVWQRFSNGAAHVPKHHGFLAARDGYMNYQLEKCRVQGRIIVEAGCLVDQLARGTVYEHTLAAPVDGPRCGAGVPCAHLAIEIEARRRSNPALRIQAAHDAHENAEAEKAARVQAKVGAEIAKHLAAELREERPKRKGGA